MWQILEFETDFILNNNLFSDLKIVLLDRIEYLFFCLEFNNLYPMKMQN